VPFGQNLHTNERLFFFVLKYLSLTPYLLMLKKKNFKMAAKKFQKFKNTQKKITKLHQKIIQKNYKNQKSFKKIQDRIT
jgi:hypothetical protein